MDDSIREQLALRRKTLLVEKSVSAAVLPGNGLRREAEKTKIVSAFITRIHHYFDIRASEADLDRQFLQTAMDLMSADGAALLQRGTDGDGFRLRRAAGLFEKGLETPGDLALPRLGSIEFCYRNAADPGDPAAERLAALAGMPHFLWTRHVDSSTALLLTREREDPRDRPPFTDNSAHVAYSGLEVYLDLLEHRAAHRDVFESELRLKSMMENLPAGIFHLGRDGRILRSNETLQAMLGYERGEELEDGSLWERFEDPAEGRAVLDELRERGAVRDRELRLRRADGRALWVSATLRVVRGADGRIVHFDGSLVDIDRRKEMEEELHESYLLATEALQGAVQAIMRMAEIRDPYTAGHQERVAQLARAIARELGVEENRAQGIYVAGILHDVGKIYVPAEILNKPGRITELERNILQTHVEVGYEILKPVRFPWPVAETVYQHHERLDGSGYPRALIEPQIILEARILAVADVVEAMLSHRPYRPGLGLDAALGEIESKSGTAFDTSAVEACVRLFREQRFSFRDY